MSRKIMSRKIALTVSLTIALLTIAASAQTNILVASSESHSIEEFNSSGTWIKTFASTGPYTPVSFAASPLTGDVFVGTNTQTILRYNKAGTWFGSNGSYWSTFNINTQLQGNITGGLLFDSKGNLYVTTYFGNTGSDVVEIYKFPASQLNEENPAPSSNPIFPIVTTLGRGDQLAWDAYLDICDASFLDPYDVQCYNTTTGKLAFDYASEIDPIELQPTGIAFNSSNDLIANDVFSGQIYVESVPRQGPLVQLASGMTPYLYWLALDSSGNIYVPSFNNPGLNGGCGAGFYACNDFDFTPDIIYEVNPSTGAVTNFITNHIWGPYQMIFVDF
jgi:hypothetical protein